MQRDRPSISAAAPRDVSRCRTARARATQGLRWKGNPSVNETQSIAPNRLPSSIRQGRRDSHRASFVPRCDSPIRPRLPALSGHCSPSIRGRSSKHQKLYNEPGHKYQSIGASERINPQRDRTAVLRGRLLLDRRWPRTTYETSACFEVGGRFGMRS